MSDDVESRGETTRRRRPDLVLTLSPTQSGKADASAARAGHAGGVAENLCSGFLSSADRFPGRPALEVGGEVLSYAVLKERAVAIGDLLARETPPGGPPVTAVFASRTGTAFAAVLGALFAGHGYVPLNRKFPAARTRVMLESSEAGAVVVDAESARQLDEVLAGLERTLLLVLPDEENVAPLARRWPQHQVVGGPALGGSAFEPVKTVPADALAYLLFTSGSTGAPKGVMVAHRNVTAFIEAMVERYEITEADRFSQTFDLTFDLSAFDMFVAWQRGACVCCPPAKTLIKPDAFIDAAALTIWFSVPSTAVFMRRLGLLKPRRYSSLRWSLFCGEPLPAHVAGAWADAAHTSTVENLYGPTELTIACTLYRWDRERSPAECEAGIVPIGRPYPGMTALVADENLHPVEPGGVGELLMTGPQLTLGYWRDPEKTAAAFVTPPGTDGVYYRTGDLVRQPREADAPIVYVGRADDQIKLLGHRVELREIEAVLRAASGVDAVIAVGWPRTDSGASGVEAFVGDTDVDVEAVRAALAQKLPDYMVPRRIHLLSELPLNANGKFDRKALIDRLERAV